MTTSISVPSDPVRESIEATDHSVRAVLRITPFRRMWLALTYSSLGDGFGLVAIAALALILAPPGSSYAEANFAVAGTFVARLAPAIFFGPLAGALADRLDRRWTLIVGDVLRAALVLSMVVVQDLRWIYIALILIECVTLFWAPALEATIPNLVPKRRLEAANQLILISSFAPIPVAAGLFLAIDAIPHVSTPLAITVVLVLNASSFLYSALVIARLDFPKRIVHTTAPEVGVLGSIIEGWRFVVGTPVVRGLVSGMLGAFAAGGLVAGLAAVFVSDLGGGQLGFAAMLIPVFAGLTVGMWVGPRLFRSVDRRKLFGLSLMAAGVMLVFMALVPFLWAAFAIAVVIGVFGGISWVIGYTLLGLEVDDDRRGRTFAFLLSSTRIVLVSVPAAGLALAGPIGRHTVRLPSGTELSYSGAALVFLLAGLIVIIMGLVAYKQMQVRGNAGMREALARTMAPRWVIPAPVVRPHRGWFIVIEGVDSAGKTTQARLLATWLHEMQGHRVVLTREPGATTIGAHVRQMVLHGDTMGPRTESLLFAADRAHHVDTVLRPALDREAVVICDRFNDSTIAYQGAGRGLDVEQVAFISQWAAAGLEPDLTIVLDVPQEIAQVRRDNTDTPGDRIERQDEDFHQRVNQTFTELAGLRPHKYLVVDGSLPRDEIQQIIRYRVREVVPVSGRMQDQLAQSLDAEIADRQRKADIEAEVRLLDAQVRERARLEAETREQERAAIIAEVAEEFTAGVQDQVAAEDGDPTETMTPVNRIDSSVSASENEPEEEPTSLPEPFTPQESMKTVKLATSKLLLGGNGDEVSSKASKAERAVPGIVPADPEPAVLAAVDAHDAPGHGSIAAQSSQLKTELFGLESDAEPASVTVTDSMVKTPVEETEETLAASLPVRPLRGQRSAPESSAAPSDEPEGATSPVGETADDLLTHPAVLRDPELLSDVRWLRDLRDPDDSVSSAEPSLFAPAQPESRARASGGEESTVTTPVSEFPTREIPDSHDQDAQANAHDGTETIEDDGVDAGSRRAWFRRRTVQEEKPVLRVRSQPPDTTEA